MNQKNMEYNNERLRGGDDDGLRGIVVLVGFLNLNFAGGDDASIFPHFRRALPRRHRGGNGLHLLPSFRHRQRVLFQSLRAKFPRSSHPNGNVSETLSDVVRSLHTAERDGRKKALVAKYEALRRFRVTREIFENDGRSESNVARDGSLLLVDKLRDRRQMRMALDGQHGGVRCVAGMLGRRWRQEIGRHRAKFQFVLAS